MMTDHLFHGDAAEVMAKFPPAASTSS